MQLLTKCRPGWIKTAEVKAEILKRVKLLKDGSFKRVYITPDMTRRQQEVDKDLCQRLTVSGKILNQTVMIRGRKIYKKNLELGERQGGGCFQTTTDEADKPGTLDVTSHSLVKVMLIRMV